MCKTQETTAMCITPAQQKLLNFIQLNGSENIAESLMKIHNLAIYHTVDISIDDDEKFYLLKVKELADSVKEIN